MRFFIPLLIFLIFPICHAQDTLFITLEQADSIFLSNNLPLLALQYQIDAREAMIIQAKAYPNPVFSADLNAYNPQTGNAFQWGADGEKFFMMEQIILLGGKRRTEIDIARKNKTIAELEFNDLLRNLRFEVHKSFFTIYKHVKLIKVYSAQLETLGKLIVLYEEQTQKGNLPLKDLIRLKSEYLQVNSNKSEIQSLYYEELKKMQLLLHTSIPIVPKTDSAFFDKISQLKNYSSILELAMQNRPDLKKADYEVQVSLLQLQLQKRMVVPDITFNVSYDQRGGAFEHQVNSGIGLPIPLWNLNRGNIRAAGYNVKSSEIMREYKNQEIVAEVNEAWNNMSKCISEYNKVVQLYSEDYSLVLTGMTENFRKGNVTILEFMDFFEAYNASLTTIEGVKTQLAIAAARINYIAASNVY